MSIVTNSSPLISLARIGKVDLLRNLYRELLIPEAVWHEVIEEGVGQAGVKEVENAKWIRVRPIENKELVKSFRQELDAGEAEAIALALETEAEFLLMDEQVGREIAHFFDLRCVGVIGVLSEAKRKGLIVEIKPFLDMLRYKAGFWVSDSLYLRVLQEEGEE